MKKLCALVLLLFPLVVCSSATLQGSSQKRLPNETFQDALNRIKETIPKKQIRAMIINDTPVGKKEAYNKIDFSIATEVSTYEELMHMFNVIRDTRFLLTEDNPNFYRRISWLYPDDGCFARAAVGGIKLNNEELTRPSKMFAFGNLMIATPYSPQGTVTWWYHVAPVVNYMGSTYVLDPALNSEAPILVAEWFNKMGTSADLQGVVCNSYSYNPFDNCRNATASSDEGAFGDQAIFLEKEWNRISYLGFDPNFLLGNNPPWILE